MIRDADPPEGVPASIAAIMASLRREVTAPARMVGDVVPAAAQEVPFTAHPISGVPTTDGRLEETPFAGHPIPGVPTAELGVTIDAEARALLAPMLRDWLDAHLPEIVEAAVHAEIRRLTGTAG